MKRTVHTQKWLDALRSGEYKQGKGLLRSKEDCFCCWGVACDLVNPEEWQESEEFSNYSHKGNTSMPSMQLIEELGCNEHESYRLIKFNDNEEYTFPQIADEIEKMLDER